MRIGSKTLSRGRFEERGRDSRQTWAADPGHARFRPRGAQYHVLRSVRTELQRTVQQSRAGSLGEEVGAPPGAYNATQTTAEAIGGYGFSDFGPVGGMGLADPIGGGEDAYGGWGGYDAVANQGPGADIESDPD